MLSAGLLGPGSKGGVHKLGNGFHAYDSMRGFARENPGLRALTGEGRLLRSAPLFMKQIIATSEAPKAVGPYSQAVAVGGLLFSPSFPH